MDLTSALLMTRQVRLFEINPNPVKFWLMMPHEVLLDAIFMVQLMTSKVAMGAVGQTTNSGNSNPNSGTLEGNI